MRDSVVENLGFIGVSQDISAHTLPANIASNALNVRFIDGAIVNIKGIAPLKVLPSFTPFWLNHTQTGVTAGWLFADETDVYFYFNLTFNKITRASGIYTAITEVKYVAEIANGIVILNNTFDVPQVWTGETPGTLLIDLPNWPATYRAKVIRSFKNSFFALNLTKGSVRYPYTVLVSHPAEPGAVPISWDITDPTLETIEFSIADTAGGEIVNALPMGEELLIYKEEVIWGIRFVGGARLYDRTQRNFAHGCVARDTLVQVPVNRNSHFFLARDRICLFNGVDISYPVENKLEQWFFSQINLQAISLCFSVVNTREKEIQLWFPVNEDTLCTQALVWNYKDNTTTIRSSAGISFASSGFATDIFDYIGDLNKGVPYEEGTVFHEEGDVGYFGGNLKKVFIIVETAPALVDKVFVQDFGFSSYNENSNHFIERTVLPLDRDKTGKLFLNLRTRKLITGVYLHLTYGQLKVKLGVQENLNDAITWSEELIFSATATKLLTFSRPIAGRFISIHLSSVESVDFKITGISLEVATLGEF